MEHRREIVFKVPNPDSCIKHRRKGSFAVSVLDVRESCQVNWQPQPILTTPQGILLSPTLAVRSMIRARKGRD